MIAAHLLFRAWAIYRSWFFTDDYRLLNEAREQGFSFRYLVDPFDSQFMPVGRLLVWIVEQSGTTNWLVAATTVLVSQALAAVACLWMLTTLFTTRPGVLALLALYLTSAMVLPGYMWWAAALNQLPLQIAFFLAVGAWVRYLRTRRKRWLVAAWAAVAFGLLCYVKALLIVPVLAVLWLGYYRGGPLRQRVTQGIRADWQALVGLVPIVGFAVYYVLAVPQPFESSDSTVMKSLDVADAMLGTSLPTAAFGGPWRWLETGPPIVLAGPPDWATRLSWVLFAGVVAYSMLRRKGAGKAWLLVAGYAVAAAALLATSRGQIFGRFAGLEYRYLTDVLPVLVLALGLAFLPLAGAPGSSEVRKPALLSVVVPPTILIAAVVLVSALGLYSSWRYVGYWHNDNAGRTFVKNAQADLGRAGPTDLASQTLPAAVMPEYTQPLNETRLFLPLISNEARFPTVSDSLHLLDETGSLRQAGVAPGLRSPDGPEPGCGWKVETKALTVPLDGTAFDFTWWVRVGYLGSREDVVTMRIGTATVTAPVNRGLNSLFVEVTSEIDEVSFEGLQPGTTLCVDTVEVGQLVPLDPS